MCDINCCMQQWSVERQMHFAGGFQGRTNKLVDSCYSFWMGAIFPQLRTHLAKQLGGIDLFANRHISNNNNTTVDDLFDNNKDNSIADDQRGGKGAGGPVAGEEAENPGVENAHTTPKIVELPDDSVADYEREERDNIGFWLYDQRALQNYILFCAQEVDGGMKDKPGKYVPLPPPPPQKNCNHESSSYAQVKGLLPFLLCAMWAVSIPTQSSGRILSYNCAGSASRKCACKCSSILSFLLYLYLLPFPSPPPSSLSLLPRLFLALLRSHLLQLPNIDVHLRNHCMLPMQFL